MTKILRDIFTGKDGATYDLARFLWFKVVVGFIILSGVAIWRGTGFDPISWGGGAAAVLAAGGAAIGLKAHAEPGG